MFRFVEERTHADNVLVNPIKVFLNRFVETLVVHFKGNLEGTGIALTPGSPFTLIKNLTININGDVFKTVSYGEMQAWLNFYCLETRPRSTLVEQDAAQEFEFELVIPFSDLRAIAESNYGVRDATLLPANASFINSVDLQWLWGTSADVTGGTVTTFDGVARVLIEERADMGLVKDPRSLQISHVQSLQEVWTSPNSDLRVDIPLSGRLARFGVACDANGTMSDVHINKISVEKQGVPIYGPVTWGEVGSRNKRDYGIETLQPGFRVIDFDPHGMAKSKDLVLAAALNSLKLVLDVADPSGTGRVRLLTVPYKSIAV